MVKNITITIVLSLFLACSGSDSSNSDSNTDASSEWSVKEIDVTGVFNLFPLSENPDFTSVPNIELSDNALVGVVNFGFSARVFPYTYSVQNEVINDTHQGTKYAFSYCPITKSAISFRRDQVFRASGYLYKSNLTPWDEKTETIWSQMLIKGIKGEKKGQRLKTIPVLETTWRTVKDYFPNAEVLAGTPSINRLQASKDEEDDIITDSSSAKAPQSGDYVYGIIDDFDTVHIFKYSDFPNRRINKSIKGQNYIVVGDASKHVIIAFKVGSFDDFEIVENEFPIVLKNRNGIKYNIFGVGTNGSILEKPKYAYVAIWWAWEDIYTNFNFVE